MKILVTGSRYGHPYVEEVLARLVNRNSDFHSFVLGDAKGVDAQALAYAELYHLQYEVFLADWSNYGNRAGPLRNGNMCATFSPGDIAVGFPSVNPLDPNRGTHDCLLQARAAGYDIYVVKADGTFLDPLYETDISRR